MKSIEECQEWVAWITSQIAWMQGKGKKQYDSYAAVARPGNKCLTSKQRLEQLALELEKAESALLSAQFELLKKTYNVFFSRENFAFRENGNVIVRAINLEEAIASVEGGYSAVLYEEKGISALKNAIARLSENLI